MDKPPYLTLVDPTSTHNVEDEEFIPLPYYPWADRPHTHALTHDEAATAIYLSHGDVIGASALLKVPPVRLRRFLRGSPRLQRVLEESLTVTLDKAASIPISTVWDDGADARRLEWAATAILKSRIARDHLLAPAPPANLSSALPAAGSGTLVLRWGKPPEPPIDVD